MSKEEGTRRGWDQFDVILITGDAYVDHPSFGAAVIGRVLEATGYSVGIIAQPNWRDDLRDFRKMGEPRLFFGVTAGNMDSMVNHYTAGKRKRSDDAYTAGGAAGFRPDYATVVYSRILKQLYPDIPIVIGGIEASMRRASHYDYWSDAVKPSVLIESGADLLVYGMADQVIPEVAHQFSNKNFLPGHLEQSAWVANAHEAELLIKTRSVIQLPSHESCMASKESFSEAFKTIEEASVNRTPFTLIQPTGNQWVVINPPAAVPDSPALDAVYNLPYTRLPHPRYKKRGDIPAYRMIRNSVTIHRGCFGGCSFCTISLHQGKEISSRSEDSILQELNTIIQTEGFDGVITDLGGPSANMYRMNGIDRGMCQKCKRPSCLWPKVCGNLNFDHRPLTALYQKASKVPGIKKIYVGSGIRYDLLTGHPKPLVSKYGLDHYTETLIRNHVSGRLKVAPEHSDPRVLSLVRKPSFDVYLDFRKRFYEISRRCGLKQEIIPYLIGSLPGSDVQAMGRLAADLAATGYKPEQVQDFTPTPMTLATTLFHTGFHPDHKKRVFTPRGDHDRRLQRMFLFWHKPENREAVIKTLKAHHQMHLVTKIYRKK